MNPANIAESGQSKVLYSAFNARQILGKKQTIDRIMGILTDGKAHKAAALANQLGVRSRTVRRYLHFMRDHLQYPITASRQGFRLVSEQASDFFGAAPQH